MKIFENKKNDNLIQKYIIPKTDGVFNQKFDIIITIDKAKKEMNTETFEKVIDLNKWNITERFNFYSCLIDEIK